MKYWISAIVILAIAGSAYWAGSQHNDSDSPEKTATPTASYTFIPTTVSPSNSPLPVRGSAEGNRIIGNRPGNIAPDFRLKDESGIDVSLRDYQNQSVKIEFFESGKLRLQGRMLLDPNDVVHRLYGVTSMPYTVNIDAQGIIR
ncbi:MAG: hypothetical protein AAB420_02680 [Patescibacteria group bacterium]